MGTSHALAYRMERQDDDESGDSFCCANGRTPDLIFVNVQKISVLCAIFFGQQFVLLTEKILSFSFEKNLVCGEEITNMMYAHDCISYKCNHIRPIINLGRYYAVFFLIVYLI